MRTLKSSAGFALLILIVLLTGCSTPAQDSGRGGVLSIFRSSGFHNSRTETSTTTHQGNIFDPSGALGVAASRVSDPKPVARESSGKGGPNSATFWGKGTDQSAYVTFGTNGTQAVTKFQTVYGFGQTNSSPGQPVVSFPSRPAYPELPRERTIWPSGGH